MNGDLLRRGNLDTGTEREGIVETPREEYPSTIQGEISASQPLEQPTLDLRLLASRTARQLMMDSTNANKLKK